MAITSSSSSTTQTGSALDVAGIVSGLMEAENVPVTKLEAKIAKSSVKITALGQIKSQLSAFKSSLIDLQTPANFSKQAAKFSNSTVATADITATAVSGSYQMVVSSLAQPAIWNISGFTDPSLALEWFSTTDLISDVDRTAFTPTIFKSDEEKYVLSLKASSDSDLFGATNGHPIEPASLDDVPAKYGADFSFFRAQPTLNAVFKLNGIEFTRSSNTVNDALTGITLNLTTTTSAAITLTVSNDPVPARPKIDAMVKAYNDLYSLYKSQTLSSIDAGTRGILNSDFGVSSMMRQLTSGLMLPLTNLSGLPFTEQSYLSSMGVKLLDNGNLAIDETLLSAVSNTLQTRLTNGMRIGYVNSSSPDLATQIGEMLLSGGLIQDRIDNEKISQTDLTNRKTTLQEKLISVQARYTAQYAALDALLFKLKGTSDSLKSALDGLTNSQKNG
jgi:flagellar hook-associated protein 2